MINFEGCSWKEPTILSNHTVPSKSSLLMDAKSSGCADGFTAFNGQSGSDST